MELKMQGFVFSVVNSLWVMSRIVKARSKIKETKKEEGGE
jgi:hypothetical protein